MRSCGFRIAYGQISTSNISMMRWHILRPAKDDMAILANRSYDKMLKQRFFTAVIALIVVGLILFVAPPIVARSMIALLLLAGAWEWGGLIYTKQDNGSKGSMLYTGICFLMIAGLFSQVTETELAQFIFQIALVWWSAALVWMFFFSTPIPRALVWICGFLVLIPAWVALDLLYRHDPTLLAFSLLVVWGADIGAYFVGKRFGSIKLAPNISPGKSWEGVLGGLTAVALLAGIANDFLDTDIAVLVPFCLAAAMLSVVGDLTVSMFKRNADVKDSGSLFPGHGGVLDRIDSVSAAAPLIALSLSWVGL
jgi:phosphatidate cytidylyltransferase